MSNNKNMTKSQAKRAQRQAELAQKKRKEKLGKFIGFIVFLAFVAAITWVITTIVMKQNDKVTPNGDYSAGLEANGYISGADASKDLIIPDYNKIIVPYEEIEFTESDIQSSINNILNGNLVLDTNPSREVALGDLVNIDYVGTIDNVEFDGGSAVDYDLEIGSGSFIDNFEEQLIGATVSSELDVYVTFPEDYHTAEYAGKNAVFHVTINGIETAPEFTDAFVAENLSEYATTVEGYKQYLKETNEDMKLTTWVKNNIIEYAEVKSYNKKYLKTLKAINLYDDLEGLESVKGFYEAYGMEAPTTPAEANGMTEEEYLTSIDVNAQNNYRNNLAYQAVVELEGATADAAFYKDYLVKQGNDASYYDTLVEQYGEPYVLQLAIQEKATEILKDKVTIQ